MKSAVVHPLIWIVEDKNAIAEPLIFLHREAVGNSVVTACFAPSSRTFLMLDEFGRNCGWVPLKSLITQAIGAGLCQAEVDPAKRPTVMEVGHA